MVINLSDGRISSKNAGIWIQSDQAKFSGILVDISFIVLARITDYPQCSQEVLFCPNTHLGTGNKGTHLIACQFVRKILTHV